MRYAFIKCEDISSAAFRGAEPVDRATWLCLLTWCYEHENGGRIVGARAWGDRRWQQTVAVMLSEVQRDAPGLWAWDGDDLVVGFYDHAYAEQVRVDSRQGAAGGRATSPAKAEAARLNGAKGGIRTQREPNTEPNGNPTPTQQPTQHGTQQENPREPSEPKPVCLSVCQSVSQSGYTYMGASAAPPDLPERLRDTWREISGVDGPDVANRALQAGRRLFRSPTPAQLLETWKCAADQHRLQDHPDQWPDFRQAVRASLRRDRAPGAVQADAETMDLARQWDAQDRAAAQQGQPT